MVLLLVFLFLKSVEVNACRAVMADAVCVRMLQPVHVKQNLDVCTSVSQSMLGRGSYFSPV